MTEYPLEILITIYMADSESNRNARWAGIVPDDVPFTVEGLLIGMLQGAFKPLYDIEGKHCARPRLPVEGLDV